MNNSGKNIKYIQTLREDFKELRFKDENELDKLIKRSYMIIKNVFGKKSEYLSHVDAYYFRPSHFPASDSAKLKSWKSGQQEIINLFETILDELNLFSTDETELTKGSREKVSSNRVFIVHGHDTEILAVVARAIEKLGLEPVILNEQPDKGRTLIEKFEGHSDVSCAIILFAPDDVGYSIKEGSDCAKPRARQNVILELGFFVGRLGRERVIALGKDAMKLEIPTDYVGVLLKEYDSAGAWKMKLVNELKEIGYDIDANKLS